MADNPLAVDLFCGLGGWTAGFLAEGYDAIGVDNDPRFAEGYEAMGGHFILADVRDLDGRDFRNARCIVASPPCNRLTSLNRFNPPPAEVLQEAIDIALDVWRIRRESGVPTLLENVQGAQRYFGKAVTHRGPWYLWGDVPLLFDGHLPPKLGELTGRNPETRGSTPLRLRQWGHRDRSPDGAAKRAHVPLRLARAVARGFL